MLVGGDLHFCVCVYVCVFFRVFGNGVGVGGE